MTTTTDDKDAIARELRTDIVRTKADAHAAIDRDDPALAIGLLKALRSLQWRARGLRIDLMAPATVTESPEE